MEGTGEEQGTPSGLVGAAGRVQLFPPDERALIDMVREGGLTPKSKPLPGSPVRSCSELQWTGGRSLKRRLLLPLWTTQRGQNWGWCLVNRSDWSLAETQGYRLS